MVIPQRIPIRKEGFSSILGGSQAKLQLVTGSKLKAQVMTLRIAKVFTVVAFSLVKRLAKGGHRGSMTILKQM